MPRRAWLSRFPKVFLVAMAVTGAAGCYIPGGGWTLRTGLDWRTHAKPGAYLELVDTRWDEWNRVAQMNAMMEPAMPVATGVQPPPAMATPPAAQPPLQEPYPIPPAAGVSGEMEDPPPFEIDLSGKRSSRAAGKFQLVERRSTTPPATARPQGSGSPTARTFSRDPVTSSSWRSSSDVADGSDTSTAGSSKSPPGGWLFRNVRR